jgi:hypothetical protein
MNDPLRLEPALDERLRDYATEEGVTVQEALDTALGLGLELCTAERIRREDRVRILETKMGDVLGALHVLGPAVFGVLRLLLTWAAQEGFKVSEDELAAELLLAARSEWALALSERGIVPPLSWDGKGD